MFSNRLRPNPKNQIHQETAGQARSSRPGASIPSEAMMHFLPPCFRFPLFPENVLTPWKISQMLPFPEIFLDFHPPKFLMTFFSHQPQISNFPLFSLFQYISPIFRQNYSFPPTFNNFLPVFGKFACFFTYFCVFRFPLLLP